MKTMGYSFWGFLGNGIANTPDGGRANRLSFLRELKKYYNLVLLQKNRDLLEAGDDFTSEFTWHTDCPPLDVLFLEWRWPILGRNIMVDRASSDYTPDLDRQDDLLAAYINASTTLIILDKDLTLTNEDYKSFAKKYKKLFVFQHSLKTSSFAEYLAFPYDCSISEAEIHSRAIAAHASKKYSVGYVGNDYEREWLLKELIELISDKVDVHVWGKWRSMTTDRFKDIRFYGRCSFSAAMHNLSQCYCTILLNRPKYCTAGQHTQRIYEATVNGTIPIGLDISYGIRAEIVNSKFIVSDAVQLLKTIRYIRSLSADNYANEVLDQYKRLKDTHNLVDVVHKIRSTINSEV